METKFPTKQKIGRPTESDAAVSHAEHDGQHRVVVHVKVYDQYGIGSIGAILSLRPDEAASLASRLQAVANQAADAILAAAKKEEPGT